MPWGMNSYEQYMEELRRQQTEQFRASTGSAWEALRNNLYGAQQPDTTSPGVYPTYSPQTGGSATNPSTPSTTNLATQPVSSMSGASQVAGSYPTAASQTAAGALAPSALSTQAAATGSADVGTNNSADDLRYDILPGRFYSDYPQSTIGKLADPKNVGDAAREWAKFTGTGGNPYARYMSGVFSDPMAMLRAMGVDPGKLDQLGPSRLDQFAMLWDRMSGGRTGAGGANLYIDPRNMLSNIMGATYDPNGKATSLGAMLDNPNLLPEEQVSNTIGLILSSMQGLISDEALNAYASTLNEFSKDWLAQRNKNPDTWDSSNTFVNALRSRFGNYGGLL